MASRALETRLTALSALREELDPERLRRGLTAALADPAAPVVARAARLAARREQIALVPALEAAFARLLERPLKRDPGCLASTALAEALQQLGAEAPAVFLQGVRHQQPEPVFGGREDKAGPLRAACLRGLVRIAHPARYLALAELLADPDPPVRMAVARAAAHDGGEGALAPLRLKVRVGDEDPQVTAECLTALLAIDPSGSLEFVAAQLAGGSPELCEVAALALGASQLAGAVAPLCHAYETAGRDRTRACHALAGLALLRRDEALGYLIALIESAPGPDAREAIEALAVHRDDPRLAARVRACAAAREDAALGEDVERAFG